MAARAFLCADNGQLLKHAKVDAQYGRRAEYHRHGVAGLGIQHDPEEDQQHQQHDDKHRNQYAPAPKHVFRYFLELARAGANAVSNVGDAFQQGNNGVSIRRSDLHADQLPYQQRRKIRRGWHYKAHRPVHGHGDGVAAKGNAGRNGHDHVKHDLQHVALHEYGLQHQQKKRGKRAYNGAQNVFMRKNEPRHFLYRHGKTPVLLLD